MSTPNFLIFDLDGTLSDPALGICRSINYALEAFAYPPIDEGSVSNYIGPPLDFSFRAITRSDDEAHIAALVAKYRERYATVGYAENQLYPGIAEVIAQLAARFPLALCTAKRLDFAEQILHLFELHPYFSVLNGGEVGKIKDRQLEEMLRAGQVGTASVMIGDRAVDVQAAHSNQLRAVAVGWGHGTADELHAAQPEALVARPEQLLELAPNWLRE